MNRASDLRLLAVRGALILLLLVLASILQGCDNAEFERIRNRSEVNERIRIHCVPVGKEMVLSAWNDGRLVCKRYTPDQSKPRRFDVESRVVATAEEILE